MLHESSTSDSFSTVDSRMIAVMRIMLAFSALLITYIDPSEPDRFVFATYLALILYSLYSIGLYFLHMRRSVPTRGFLNFSHWADVAWYLVLIALSSGTSSIFFFFFFFVILYTAFTRGFLAGFTVTFVSSITFTAIGYASAPSGAEFELNRFLLRPIYLIVLGYMMSYWGGYEILAKRRLAILREISIISNPRFGVNRTVGIMLELLREFYEADGCLLIMAEPETAEYIARRAERGDPEAAFHSHQLNPQLLARFLSLPEHAAVIYNPSRRLLTRGVRFYTFDLEKRVSSTEKRADYEEIAERLDTRAFLTIPVYFRKKIVGRLFVFTAQPDKFEKSDIDFLLQALSQFMPVVENMRLVDHLASNAAEEERKRIARDIHDSIIQPYIGLQYGLISVEQVLDSETPNDDSASKNLRLIHERIKKLKNLTDAGIDNLRNFTRGLKESGKTEGTLLPAVERFAGEFSKATGIGVEIKPKCRIQVADRLAAELFQIVVEGLNNIKKHTHSPFAVVSFDIKSGMFFLEIENLCDGSESGEFKPASITERVVALGGSFEIRRRERKTVLALAIPL